ncbi:MAG TPA: transposase [Nitrososphaera sp.]|nr:transposase [Nitrososphaera sp.]
MKTDSLDFDALRTNDDCRRKLLELRFEKGFSCPACHHTQCYISRVRIMVECKRCGKQISGTSGTKLHGARLVRSILIMMHDYSQGRHKSAQTVSDEQNIAYATAWSHLHDIRSFLGEEVLAEPQMGIPVNLLALALIKQSSVNDWVAPSEIGVPVDETALGAELIEMEAVMRASQADQIPEARSAEEDTDGDDPPPASGTPPRNGLINRFIEFLLTIFRGVSLKHAQKYAFEFAFSLRKLKPSFRSLVRDYLRCRITPGVLCPTN